MKLQHDMLPEGGEKTVTTLAENPKLEAIAWPKTFVHSVTWVSPDSNATHGITFLSPVGVPDELIHVLDARAIKRVDRVIVETPHPKVQ